MSRQILMSMLLLILSPLQAADTRQSYVQTQERHMMKDTIFREYDIRGKVGDELIIDEVYNFTRAMAFYFKQKNPATKTIAVGMDGRIHSEAIKNEMCRGFADSGMDVIFVGTCPTPALYYALHTLPVDGGIMITASHNPKEYNGMKVCLGTESVWGKEIGRLRDLYKAGKYVDSDTIGTIKDQPIVDSYIDWLVDHFKHLIGMHQSVVIDCGNGAAGTVLPSLIKRMQWRNVTLLYEEVDGTYPNHEADPIVEKNMQDVKHMLSTTDIALGIGLDGDCDRMAPMQKTGQLVPGDKLLALFAQQVLQESPGASIVFDIKSSAGLIELLDTWGGRGCISPSGHSIIKDQMKKHNAKLAGELSCHFFFHDRYFGYDDGIYAMMRLFELLNQTGKSLGQLLEVFPKKVSSPEYRIDYDEDSKHAIIQTLKKTFEGRADVDVLTIDGVRATMPYGWGIVRPSNTQPKLCLRFESDSHEGLQRVKDDFIQALTPYFDPHNLAQQLNE